MVVALRTVVTLPALLAATLLVSAPVASASGSGTHHARVQPKCARADASTAAASKQAMRAAVVCLVNRQRAAHHLPPLHAQPLLDHSAQRWTNVMVATGQFTHGVDFAARLTAAGFDWSSAGENIATGYPTPRQVVTAWMASPDHCTNILDPAYSDVGTGVSGRRVGQYAGGTWTQDFGLWMGHPAPSGNHWPANGCPYHL